MKIEWPSKNELKDVFLIILGIVCAIQCAIIVLGVSVVTDLRDTAQDYKHNSDTCMMDYNYLWNDYSLLQDEWEQGCDCEG